MRPLVRVFMVLLIFQSVTPVSGRSGKGGSAVSFANPAPITINSVAGVTAPTVSAPYGTSINVSGLTGTVSKIEVVIRGVAHGNLSDLDFLLVGPTGTKYVFASDMPTAMPDDSVFVFSDTAQTMLGGLLSGTYLPTNSGTTDTFPAPAPAGPYNFAPTATFATVFNGTDPNGTWSLFAVDDSLDNAGSLNSGWSLNITTSGAPVTFSNTEYVAFRDHSTPASPYGSPISVSGLSGVISKVTITINGLTHANGQDLDMLLVSPNGRSATILSDAGAVSAVSNVTLTFDDDAASLSTWVSGTYRPTENASAADTYFSPAPIRPYHGPGSGSALNGFNGFAPNGEWKLYVVDDSSFSSGGQIASGWSIEITTVPIVPPAPASCSSPTFTTSTIGAGANPTNIALADFNNDSKADAAITNQVSNDVTILLGNGDGSFSSAPSLTAGSGPYSLVAGKFNADNNFDLAVANSGSNNVSIYLGNGNGGFVAGPTFLVGASPISIATGDVNNDSKADIVVANFGSFFFGSVSVILGNGNGSFASGTSLRTRTQPSAVALRQLNTDSTLDLVVANFGSDSLSTFLGNGGGQFVQQQNLQTGPGPVAVEIADFGADGFADIAVANYNGDTVTMCSGNVNGVFTGCNIGSAFGANPVSITSADFDGSGIRAIAIANSGSNYVSVLGNSVTTGLFPNAVAAGDFNLDGKPDLITVNSGSNDVTVALNNCRAARGNIFDFNGDRKSDNAVFRSQNSTFWVRPMSQNSYARALGRPTDRIVPADYDGDRRADFAIFRPENGLWMVVDQFARPIYYTQFGLASDVPAPADYDGDGKADITVWRPTDGVWYIRRSSDNVITSTQFGMDGDVPAASDFDGDGRDDIAVFRPSTGLWYILRSSDGQATIVQFGLPGDRVVPGDYDGDTKADIAVWRPSTGVWYVLKSSDGGFLASAFGLSTDVPMVGDYEGDGRFDFAIYRPSEGNWYVLKSSDGGLSVSTWGNATDIPLPSAFVR